MRSLRTALTLLVLASSALAGAAGAPRTQPEQALSRACSGDLAALCPNANPDGPEVEECFRQHMKELSPPCAKAVSDHKDAAEQNRRGR